MAQYVKFYTILLLLLASLVLSGHQNYTPATREETHPNPSLYWSLISVIK